MKVQSYEILVGEVAMFKLPIGLDGSVKETWFACCPEQEQPAYLLLKNI